MKLTAMEIKILNAMRNNEYNDALEENGACGTWSFTAIYNSGIAAKKARGVISSLVKKGLVGVTTQNHVKDDPETIWFTKEGVKLFDNADGEECSWGGPKLLKESDIDIPDTIPTDGEAHIYTIVEIAEELNMDPKKARKILREQKVEKEGKQWQWDTKEKYKEIKKLLSK
jgi:predicted transcriptional regulator